MNVIKSVVKRILVLPPNMFLVNFLQKIYNIKNSSSNEPGLITITFDDGLESVFSNAYPIMKKHDIRGNVAVIVDSVGKPGYMSLEQLRELSQNGWSIVSHSMTHRDLLALSPQEVESELRESRKWIIEQGFKGHNTFISPGHKYNSTIDSITKKYYSFSRNKTNFKGILGCYGFYRPNSLPFSPFSISSFPFERFYQSNQGRKKMKNYLDYAINNNKLGAIYSHELSDEMVLPFKEIIEFISKHKKNVITYHELQ